MRQGEQQHPYLLNFARFQIVVWLFKDMVWLKNFQIIRKWCQDKKFWQKFILTTFLKVLMSHHVLWMRLCILRRTETSWGARKLNYTYSTTSWGAGKLNHTYSTTSRGVGKINYMYSTTSWELGSSIIRILRRPEALGSSIARILRCLDALGSSSIRILRPPEALGSSIQTHKCIPFVGNARVFATVR